MSRSSTTILNLTYASDGVIVNVYVDAYRITETGKYVGFMSGLVPRMQFSSGHECWSTYRIRNQQVLLNSLAMTKSMDVGASCAYSCTTFSVMQFATHGVI